MSTKSDLCDAIAIQYVVEFDYDGYRRVVEPYKVGSSPTGNDVLDAYQIGGGTSSGEVPAWKLFELEEILQVSIPRQSFSLRGGYSRSDERMELIHCRV